jgi:hypothetical protein
MKFSYNIYPDRRLIVQAYEGSFTLEQLIACTRYLWADPQYSPAFNGITELSAMSPSAGLANLPLLMEFLKNEPQLSSGRWAAIVSTPIVTAGTLIYKKSMAPQHMFEVFSTWEAACTFLQIDAEKPQLLERAIA